MVTICTAHVVDEHEGTTMKLLQDLTVKQHNRQCLDPVVKFAEHMNCQLYITSTKLHKRRVFCTMGSICHSMSCCAIF